MISPREKYMAIVSNDIIASSDVIILLEGDGHNRVQKAVDLYKKGFAPKILFSGGAVNYDYGSFPVSDILPRLIELGVDRSDIIIDDESLHTLAQAEEFIKLANTHKWKSAILVASPDHQYRAYLTFLRQILNHKPLISLYNSSPENLPWNKDNGWGTPMNRIEQEFERIDKYSALGHLATYEEAIDYQIWKEQALKQPN